MRAVPFEHLTAMTQRSDLHLNLLNLAPISKNVPRYLCHHQLLITTACAVGGSSVRHGSPLRLSSPQPHTHTYVPNVTDRMLWLLQGMFPDARTDVGGNRHFERVSGA